MTSIIPSGPWPPRHWRARDMLIQVVVITAAIVIAAATSAIFGWTWGGTSVVAAFCLGHVALKLFFPNSTVMRDIAWSSLLIAGVVALAGAWLLDNPTLLDGWTLIVVFVLFLGYGLGTLIGWSRSQTRSSQEHSDGPD